MFQNLRANNQLFILHKDENPLVDIGSVVSVSADFGQNGNIVISCSREAMNSEVSAIRQKSLDELNRRNYHENVIAGCDKILTVLNPEFAEKQRQEQEIATLKGQMSEMSRSMADLMAMNKKLMEQLGVAETKNKK